MENLCALVLAGGAGTRFWPKSTKAKPKQFLSLINEKTMLQLTVDRIKKQVGLDKIFIVVLEEHKQLVLDQIEGIMERNIIIQPEIKNTAPCIMMAVNYINQIYNNTNIIALPSDHLITQEQRFLDNISIANDYINENKKGIVTIGIVPSRPEVGYGYIKLQNGFSMDKINKISEFVEKPCLEKAIEYLASGKYLWNAGMFLFNSEYMLNLYSEYLTKTYSLITSLPNITDINYLKKLKENYQLCDDISFDCAIMEKNSSSYVIPSNIGWDDIGTWASLERYCDKDGNHNISKGMVEFRDSNNNIVYGDNKKIILLGIDDIFCVDTEDVIIIANKDQMNKVYSLKK